MIVIFLLNHPYIGLLSGRIRKLLFVFKKLRRVAEPSLLKTIYFALCQSLLIYCVTSWGGAAISSMLILERAQRALLKVATFKPKLYPTKSLYEFCQVLTVRQLFIYHTVLLQHSHTPLEENYLNRRNHLVASTTVFKTKFSDRFFCFLGPFLYNNLNKKLNTHILTTPIFKKTVYDWLQNLSYDDTEKFIKPTQ